jgi:hypothetical protein
MLELSHCTHDSRTSSKHIPFQVGHFEPAIIRICSQLRTVANSLFQASEGTHPSLPPHRSLPPQTIKGTRAQAQVRRSLRVSSKLDLLQDASAIECEGAVFVSDSGSEL